jgi:hypothetical protein
MKRQTTWIVAVALAAAAAFAEEPAETLARGKLESDLGHPAAAAEAFSAVARAPQATSAQRWEALVRLAVARRDAGDARGSADAFEEAFRTYGKDPEALRFLLLAAGSALPGQDRWQRVWQRVSVEVDRRSPDHPTIRVVWPDVAAGLCPCTGHPIDLDLQDANLQGVFRRMADVSGLNVVVHPGTFGTVTYRCRELPWDEALERMLAPNGYSARIVANVLEVGPPAKLGRLPAFTGPPISFDFVAKDLVEAIRELAVQADVGVEIPDGVMGKVTFKLNEVRWDQAFDLVVRLNGLTWTRTGDRIRVLPPAGSTRVRAPQITIDRARPAEPR